MVLLITFYANIETYIYICDINILFKVSQELSPVDFNLIFLHNDTMSMV